MDSRGGYFFILIFALTVVALLKLYLPFLMNLLIAFLLFLATQGIYRLIVDKIKLNVLSSFIVTLLLLVVCFVPILYVVIHLAELATSLDLSKIQSFVNYAKSHLQETYGILLGYLPDWILAEFNKILLKLDAINWVDIVKQGFSAFAQVGKNGIFFLVDTCFIVVFLFFFYYYSNPLGEYLLKLIPIEETQIRLLYNEVSAVIGVVFYSSIMSIVLQGALFGVLMFYFGNSALLLGVFYGFASLIPLVGGALVWLPVVLYEVYLGNFTNAIIIGAYSLLVIATLADNVVKPFLIAFVNRVLIKTPVRINEILIFFAIFAGIASFGFWGIVLGPAITALFIALLRIYQNLYQKS